MRNTLQIQDAYPAGKIHGSGDTRGAVGVILLDLIPGDPLENLGFLNPEILDSAALKILVPTGGTLPLEDADGVPRHHELHLCRRTSREEKQSPSPQGD